MPHAVADSAHDVPFVDLPLDDLRHRLKEAKVYITGALKANLNLGHGSGPLDHCWNINQTLK